MLSNAASRGYEAVVESDSKTLTLTAIDALLDIFIRLFILPNRGGGVNIRPASPSNFAKFYNK